MENKMGFANTFLSANSGKIEFCNYNCLSLPWWLRLLHGVTKKSLITKAAYEKLPKITRRYLEPNNPRVKFIPRIR